MNLCGSPKNHENHNVYDGTLSHCLSEAQRAGFFKIVCSRSTAGATVCGAAGIIIPGAV
jgi:hypothetical protein